MGAQKEILKPEEELKIRNLARQLSDPNPQKRLKAAEELGTFATSAPEKFDKYAVPQLDIALSDKEAQVRVAAAKTLAVTDKGLAVLKDEIGASKDQRQISDLVRALGEVQTEKSLALLGELASARLKLGMKKPMDLAIVAFSIEAIRNIGCSDETAEDVRETASAKLTKMHEMAVKEWEAAKGEDLLIASICAAAKRRMWEREHAPALSDYDKQAGTLKTDSDIATFVELEQKLAKLTMSNPDLFAGYDSRFDISTRVLYERLATLLFYARIVKLTSPTEIEIIVPNKGAGRFEQIDVTMTEERVQEKLIKAVPTAKEAKGKMPEIAEFNVPEQLRNLALNTLNRLNGVGGEARPAAIEALGGVTASALKDIQAQGAKTQVMAGFFNLEDAAKELREALKAILVEAVADTDPNVAKNAAFTMRYLGADESLKRTVEDTTLDIDVRMAALGSFVTALSAERKPVADFLAEMYVKMPALRERIIDYFVEVGRSGGKNAEAAVTHMSSIINDELSVGGREYTERDPKMKMALIAGLGRTRTRQAVESLVSIAIAHEQFEFAEAAAGVIDDLYVGSDFRGLLQEGRRFSSLISDKSEIVRAAAFVTPAIAAQLDMLGPEEVGAKIAALQLLAGSERRGGFIGDIRAKKGVLALLKDPEDSIRAAAAGALGAIVGAGDRTAINSLIERTGDEFASVRAAALTALGRIGQGEQRAIETGRTLLETDESALVRKAAVKSLAGVREARDLLSRVLENEAEDAGVRVAAAAALKRADVLMEIAFDKGAETGNRVEALHALSIFERNEQYAQRVQPLLKDKNWEIRRAAIETLSALGKPIMGGIVEALKDENAKVRASAVEAISAVTVSKGTENVETASKGLLAAIQNKDETTNTRAQALDAYFAMVVKESELMKAFLPLINDPNRTIASNAISRIGNLERRGDALDDLLGLARSPQVAGSPELRNSLKEALTKIDEDLAGAGVAKKLFTKVKAKRQQIAAALKVIEQ